VADDGPMATFAKANGLTYADTVTGPSEGNVLNHSSGQITNTATGKLPGGAEGTIADYEWTTTDSDNNTEHHRRTVAWTRVPESIGFAPALSQTLTGVGEVKKVDLDEKLPNGDIYAYKGSSDEWLRQLFSPALIDYLSRSPEDQYWELSQGLLCLVRGDFRTDPAELTAMCQDLGHLAGAIRQESVEEVETGGAATAAAKEVDGDPAMDVALAKVTLDSSPADVVAAKSAFRSHVMGRPSEWLRSLISAGIITLLINIPAAAITINLIVAKSWNWLIGFELILLVPIFFFVVRSRFRGESQKYAQEAFFRSYAADRHLKLDSPLQFSATHAEANVGFKPDRVFSGELPGGATGSLAFCGDGTSRESRIAVVAGPKGPTASAELRSSPGGLSAKDLDDYSARLAKELAGTVQPAPA
jgi:hypothetical protein